MSGNSAFSGLRISILLSFVTCPAHYIAAPSVEESPSQQHLLFASLLEDGHSALHEGLALAALIGTHLTVTLGISYVHYALWMPSLGKCSFTSSASFSVGLVFFFFYSFIELYKLPACFLDKFEFLFFGCKLPFSYASCCLSFFRVFPCGAIAFQVAEVPFAELGLICHYSKSGSKNNLLPFLSQCVLPIFSSRAVRVSSCF